MRMVIKLCRKKAKCKKRSDESEKKTHRITCKNVFNC